MGSSSSPRPPLRSPGRVASPLTPTCTFPALRAASSRLPSTASRREVAYTLWEPSRYSTDSFVGSSQWRTRLKMAERGREDTTAYVPASRSVKVASVSTSLRALGKEDLGVYLSTSYSPRRGAAASLPWASLSARCSPVAMGVSTTSPPMPTRVRAVDTRRSSSPRSGRANRRERPWM